MLTKSNSPLADIIEAKRAIYLENRAGIPNPVHFYYRLAPRERELQQQAFAAFAKLNGWSPNPARPFRLNQIAGCGADSDLHCRDLFDHCLYFRKHCRPAALAVQPYVDPAYRCLDDALEIADRLGLALHMPPALKASIHNTGGTAFLLFTSRTHTVRWLPEQERGVDRACRMYRIVGRPT